ncbi:uncharacterized protein LOC124497755 [Dermatophagoides farinae]|uniref:uncharacterized protein LOC124497755 n=1 Tax=Dermatophagoides farinae TaxID=6954 RepID=UPI003F5DDCE5
MVTYNIRCRLFNVHDGRNDTFVNSKNFRKKRNLLNNQQQQQQQQQRQQQTTKNLIEHLGNLLKKFHQQQRLLRTSDNQSIKTLSSSSSSSSSSIENQYKTNEMSIINGQQVFVDHIHKMSTILPLSLLSISTAATTTTTTIAYPLFDYPHHNHQYSLKNHHIKSLSSENNGHIDDGIQNFENNNSTLNELYANEIIRLAMEFNRQRPLSIRDCSVIIMYGLIVLVSLFGNLLVCKVILFKQAMRRRITHIFIANLTISDLLMTIFTIPMNTARQILDDWPFGEFCCKLVPFVQAISVYVSALSMTMIAIDRYQALVRPLQPRLIQRLPRWIWITSIWLFASLISIPFAIFNHVVNVLTIHPYIPFGSNEKLFRCKALYPGNDPEYYQRLITCLAFVTQFCIPMIIVAYCYITIGMKISKRSCIGETIDGGQQTYLKQKRKTIKMLIFVVATFAICWLPYNLLFIVEDFFHINFSLTIHYLIHWLAMSSICYNPFIYFWLNRGYRQGILNILKYCYCCRYYHRHHHHHHDHHNDHHQHRNSATNNENNENENRIKNTDYVNDPFSEMDTINMQINHNHHHNQNEIIITNKQQQKQQQNLKCENESNPIIISNGNGNGNDNGNHRRDENAIATTPATTMTLPPSKTIIRLTKKPMSLKQTIVRIIPSNNNHHNVKNNNKMSITMTEITSLKHCNQNDDHHYCDDDNDNDDDDENCK